MLHSFLRDYVYHVNRQQWLLLMLGVFVVGVMLLRGAGSRKHG